MNKTNKFEKQLKKTYKAIEKVNPELALNFHFGKHGEIVSEDAYIEARCGNDFVSCYDANFTDFITQNKGNIEFYIRFMDSWVDWPEDYFIPEQD